MAIAREPDGSIALRTDADGAIHATLSERFGHDPRAAKDRIGGAIMMLIWEHTHDGVDHAAVASAGLDRIPFEDAETFEVVCEVRADQAGAAMIAVETVVQRVVEELEGPWEPKRVWVNDQPLLVGTRIQALMVTPSGRGPEFDELRIDGRRVGRLDTISMLTVTEAQTLQMMGADAVGKALGQDHLRFADVERVEDAVRLPVPWADLPDAGPGSGERRDEITLLRDQCMIYKGLYDAPAHYIVMAEDGAVAITGLESEAELEDSENCELWTMAELVVRNPWLREFTLTAAVGEAAEYLVDEGRWEVGPEEDDEA